MKKFFEFFAYGIVTPFVYLFYSIVTILFTFMIGFPIAIGIEFIRMAVGLLLKGEF